MSLETLAVELALAFTAGVLSLFSPCSFPFLPGYIAYLVGSKTSIRRAIAIGTVCTIGLTSIFVALGVLASVVGDIIAQYIPWVQRIAALLIIVLGLTLLVGIPIRLPTPPLKPMKRPGFIGAYAFGLTYGLIASTCAAPIFISIMLYAFVGGVLQGIIAFLAYSLGMGAVLIPLAAFTAEAEKGLVKKVTAAIPLIEKVSGLMLIAVGIYLFIYFTK